MVIGFNERLRKLRLAKGQNAKEFSQTVGISDSMILRYESGERQPSLKILCKLATTLGVTTDYLLGMEKNTNDNKDSAIYVDLSALTPKQIQAVKIIIQECEEMNQ